MDGYNPPTSGWSVQHASSAYFNTGSRGHSQNYCITLGNDNYKTHPTLSKETNDEVLQSEFTCSKLTIETLEQGVK